GEHEAPLLARGHAQPFGDRGDHDVGEPDPAAIGAVAPGSNSCVLSQRRANVSTIIRPAEGST
ncbi:MAG: hypothetical protein WD011_05870, partial [Nitriliruptoraceae bacterium]